MRKALVRRLVRRRIMNDAGNDRRPCLPSSVTRVFRTPHFSAQTPPLEVPKSISCIVPVSIPRLYIIVMCGPSSPLYTNFPTATNFCVTSLVFAHTFH